MNVHPIIWPFLGCCAFWALPLIFLVWGWV
jgi:hypothetical protein